MKNIKSKTIFFLFILKFFHGDLINCQNILIVMPMVWQSHFKSFQPLFEELVQQRYNLTVISPFRLRDDLQAKYTHVNVQSNLLGKSIFHDPTTLRKQSSYEKLIYYSNFIHNYVEECLKLPALQRIVDSKDRYDLVIAEFITMDVFFAFGFKFEAPIIALSPHNAMLTPYNWILHNPFSSSYISNMFFPIGKKISLSWRLKNTMLNCFWVLLHEVNLIRTQSLMEKYFHFENKDVPNIREIIRNVSVVLINSCLSLGYPKPNLPNIVNVAGLHLTPVKPLPKNIQTFMDEAVHGVIYISLGTLIEPSSLQTLGKIFIQELKTRPEKVIMKWDSQLLEEIPDNVLVEKWLPQNDVLNHPNCRLFISHGGIHSIIESLNASVPILGIPLVSDQLYNMDIIENYGVAKTLIFEDISTKLSAGINDVLNDPKYKKNMEKRSQIFRDRLVSPLDEVMYWVDHVIKYKNTDHLKSAALQLKWYEVYSLDVIAILLVTILSVSMIVKFIAVRIFFKVESLMKQMWLLNLKSQRIEKKQN